ncbi:hypothetical protein [Cupriavidus alkaliphilus]|uniref:hypothetical protein n=1 Tax=Cupriavidus alkaliphilus TaxID=942866 RepID=UPI0015EBC371|nr:hypothetical protein [Cupriavidus alkaliphilus]
MAGDVDLDWSTDFAKNWQCTEPMQASIFHSVGRQTSARCIEPESNLLNLLNLLKGDRSWKNG